LLFTDNPSIHIRNKTAQIILLKRISKQYRDEKQDRKYERQKVELVNETSDEDINDWIQCSKLMVPKPIAISDQNRKRAHLLST
jgi:hypothetical protein